MSFFGHIIDDILKLFGLLTGDLTAPVAALITADASALGNLVSVADLTLVRGTASEQADGQWSVVTYASTDTLNSLSNSGYEIVVLSDSATLRQRWDTILGQIES